jgi:thymidylate synthase (FAD)
MTCDIFIKGDFNMANYFIRPSVRYVSKINGFHIMKNLEKAARTCYQSNDKEHNTSTANFLRGCIKRGHESILEHESISVDVITSRDVLAEWTRHRIGVAYSVESTRYVNYKEGMEFIYPIEYDDINTKNCSDYDPIMVRERTFRDACETSAHFYSEMIKNGAKPQEARAVLPQALKVNMKVTMNIRAWRHFFELRCAPSAHPNIKEIAIAILFEFRKKMLPLFEDIPYDIAFYEKNKVRIDAIFKEEFNKIDIETLKEKAEKNQNIDEKQCKNCTEETCECNKEKNPFKDFDDALVDLMNAIMHEEKHEKKVRDMTASMLDNEPSDIEKLRKRINNDKNHTIVIDIDDLLNKFFD